MNERWESTPQGRALVTGATGLVGRALLRALAGNALATTRRASTQVGQLEGASELVRWDTVSTLPSNALGGVDAIFHLAGEPVAEGRWTEAKRQRIRASRIDSTRALVRSIERIDASVRPRVLVCASAVGIYGSRGDEVLDEDTAPAEGFLADVCREWEAEAARAESLGVRVVSLRIGIVLAREGGALAKMLTPFELGLGAALGSGAQWMPWIHVDDVVGLLRFAAATGTLRGPLNAAAPVAVTNAEFTKALGRAVHRPALLRAPRFALELALGEVAAVVLASQRVVPKRALDAGFEFAHPTLDEALAATLEGKPTSTSHRAAGRFA